MTRNLLLFAAAGLIALIAGIYTQRLTVAAPDPALLPEFSLPDAAGRLRASSEWKGKVRVINFWATWCPPCREEIPEFVRMQAEYAGQGLQFIGIAVEDKAPVEEFAKTMGINYPVLIDEAGGIALSVRLGNVIGALPFSVVVDRAGKIVHAQPGAFDRKSLEALITPLL